MIDVTFIMFENCDLCDYIKKILYKLEGEYDLSITEVDGSSDFGKKLLKKYKAKEKPVIIIDDKFFSQGKVTEKALVDKFIEIRSPHL